MRRVPALDGLRAVAVAAVLVYHADTEWLPGGFLGVDLFFVLSGFLITTLLLEELRRSATASLRFGRFYLRRARRLLPALAAVVGVTLVAMCTWWRTDLGNDRGDVPAVLGFVGNWWYVFRHQDYFAAVGRPSPFQHLWSLGVEEQFYLVWPVTLWLLWRFVRRKPLGVVGGVALLGAAASAVWMAHLAAVGDVPYRASGSRLYFGTDTHAVGLLLGAAGAAARLKVLSLRLRPGPRVPRAIRADALALASTVAVLVLTWRMQEFSPGLYRYGFTAFSSVALVAVLATAHSRGLAATVLGCPPVRWLGERSYGVYLWHWPVFVFTRPHLDLPVGSLGALALRIPATLLLAEASYRLVEAPIRRRGFVPVLQQAFGGIPERALALAALGVPCLAAAVVTLPPVAPGGLAAVAAESSNPLRPAAAPPAARPRVSAPQPTASGVAARNRPHPAARKPVRQTVTLIGDSVMLGAESALRHALGPSNRGSDWHVREGFQPSDELDLLAALARRHAVASDVVLHIGTNGPIDPHRLDQLLDDLRGHRVVLVTDHMPQPWHGVNNRTIKTAVKQHAGVALADWDALADHHDGWFWDDGIHVRPSGADAYARLVMGALRGH
ncbi:MAG TPA: acyltransferase family protein [Mycobacteriales bacterium]|nr:acyltransferase family protein [Mycobacteriales bacterium]